jgi:hypothetical protein
VPLADPHVDPDAVLDAEAALGGDSDAAGHDPVTARAQ